MSKVSRSKKGGNAGPKLNVSERHKREQANGGGKRTRHRARSGSQPQPEAQDQDSARVENPNVWSHDERVAELLHRRDNKVDELAFEMAKDRARDNFLLGGILAEIKRDPNKLPAAYRDQKEGFNLFCQERLGFEKSKGYALAKTYEAFRRAGIGSADFESIGWTKARELAQVGADKLKEDKDALLEFAREHGSRELADHVRHTYTRVGGENVPTAIVGGLKFYGDEGNTVERAVEVAKSKVGDDDIKKSIEFICGEWLQLSEGVEVSLESGLRALVRRHGLEAVREYVLGLPDGAEDSTRLENAVAEAAE